MGELVSYLRISTGGQDVAAQRVDVERWAAREGVRVRHVRETASGGSRSGRPRLRALLAAARQGSVGTVVVARIDRLARSLRDLIAIVGELEACGTRLVVLSPEIDTASAEGRLLLGVLGSVGEFERSLVSARTKAGLRAARARGMKLGRCPALLGERAELARHLLREGRSVRHVARTLGCSAAAVRTARDAA